MLRARALRGSLFRWSAASLLATSLGALGCAAPQRPPQAAAAEQPTTTKVAAPPSDNDSKAGQVHSRREFNSLEEAQAAFDQDLAQLDALLGSGVAVTLDSHGGGCSRACRAFVSLNRAAASICELAGSETPRCAAARGKVDENQRRMQEAGCNCD